LLDKWTVTKPELDDSVIAKLSAPRKIKAGQTLTYTVSIRNDSEYGLNGTQVRFRLPQSVTFAGTRSDTVTVDGNEIIVTVGHVAAGSDQTVEIPVLVSSDAHGFFPLLASAALTSSTALPVRTNDVFTKVVP
jgi:uncharacterized repeat protein (TIGR01451 family)